MPYNATVTEGQVCAQLRCVERRLPFRRYCNQFETPSGSKHAVSMKLTVHCVVGQRVMELPLEGKINLLPQATPC